MQIQSAQHCLLVCLLAFLIRASQAGECRQGAEAATSHCGLPDHLSNFQGYYACNSAVKVGKPHNKQDLAKLVGHFNHVKAVGIGHSWWGTQFCSGNTTDSINIVTTELDTTLNAILRPIFYNASFPPPASWPIQINEAKRTVTVQAGVPQRILLNSLAEYSSAVAPSGYSIPAFPWYIDQTIAGAISTGTHGSSFLFGSVSSQTVRIEMVLANGTLANFTKDSNPALWHAAQVSVGRLGVITEVEMVIMPQDMVEREVTTTDFSEFVAAMRVLQEDYNAALSGTGSKSVAEVLAEYEGTQLFWFVPTNTTTWLSYKGLEEHARQALVAAPEAEVHTASIGASAPVTASMQQPVSYSHAPQTSFAPGPYLTSAVPQVPVPAMPPVMLPATDPLTWNSLQYSFLTSYLTNGTYTRRDSILSENEAVNKATSDTNPYDQYEFSIPLQTIGDCLQTVHDTMYEQNLLLGFPVPGLIRFVGEEDAFLSNANGGPRIFFNIEDHQSYQTGTANHRFDAVVKVLREDCKARMHWGKAGWDKWANCFDGSVEYGKNWCNFGCAVKALDPFSKFASQSNVWAWRATLNGRDVPYEQCCDGNGFKSACTCAKRTDCVFRPPALSDLTPR